MISHHRERFNRYCVNIFRALQLCVLTVFLIIAETQPVFGSQVWHVIDVGYGDAVLLEGAFGANILIDAGSVETAPRLLQYLRDQNIDNLYALICTHPHPDHYGGMESVYTNMPVRRIYRNADPGGSGDYKRILSSAEQSGIPVEVLTVGDQINDPDGEWSLTVLDDYIGGDGINDGSLVLLWTFKETSFLLMGDLEEQAQSRFFNNHPEIDPDSAVKVPHHGGHLIPAYTRMFSSDSVHVISVGANPWGRPAEEDLRRIPGKVFRTDRDGSVRLITDGSQWSVKMERKRP